MQWSPLISTSQCMVSYVSKDECDEQVKRHAMQLQSADLLILRRLQPMTLLISSRFQPMTLHRKGHVMHGH